MDVKWIFDHVMLALIVGLLSWTGYALQYANNRLVAIETQLEQITSFGAKIDNHESRLIRLETINNEKGKI